MTKPYKRLWNRELEKTETSSHIYENTHVKSIYGEARFWEVAHKGLVHSSPLSELLPSSSVCAVEKGALLARGKTDAIVAIDGTELKLQRSENHYTNAFLPVWELVTVTLELRRFHVSIFLFSHIPPVAARQRASSCIQKFFKRRKKVFLAMQKTRTAWLIVKWRNSWGWGVRAEGEEGSEREF